MNFKPELIPDALAVFDPSDTAGLNSAADNSGSAPAVLDDVVKRAVNKVAGGPPFSDSIGALWSPAGYNSRPAFKFNGAHQLKTAALFAAKHERDITIVLNILSSSSAGSPVLFSDTGGAMFLQEIGADHKWTKAGGSFSVGTAATSIPETILATCGNQKFRSIAAQDSYRRDPGPGAATTADSGFPVTTDLGITGAGICIGAYGGGGFYASCMVNYAAIIGRKLVGAELSDLMGYCAEKGNVGNCDSIIFTGDSIIDGTTTGGDDTSLAANNVVEMVYADLAGEGYRFNRLRDSYPGRNGEEWLVEANNYLIPYIYKALSSKTVAFVQIAHNDLRIAGVSVTFSRVAEICKRYKQMGVPTVVVIPTPSTIVGFEALRQSYKDLLLANQGSADPICSELLRLDLDPNIGFAAHAADLTKYKDGIHLTTYGNTLMKIPYKNKVRRALDGHIRLNMNNSYYRRYL